MVNAAQTPRMAQSFRNPGKPDAIAVLHLLLPWIISRRPQARNGADANSCRIGKCEKYPFCVEFLTFFRRVGRSVGPGILGGVALGLFALLPGEGGALVEVGCQVLDVDALGGLLAPLHADDDLARRSLCQKPIH